MPPGSRRPPDRIVKDLVTAPGSDYTSVERLVAMAIGDHLNADGVAWPSLPRLEAWTGLSHRTVQGAIATLCSGRHALFRRDAGVRWMESCRYTLIAIDARGAAPKKGAPRAPHAAMERGASPAPHDDGVQVVPRRVHHVREKGAGGAPRTPNRTPHRTPTPPNPPQGGSRTAARLEASIRFAGSLGAHLSSEDRRGLRAMLREGRTDGEIAARINESHRARRAKAAEGAAERRAWEEGTRWIEAHGGKRVAAELVRREARAADGIDGWRRALERLGAPPGSLAELGGLLGDPKRPRSPPAAARGIESSTRGEGKREAG